MIRWLVIGAIPLSLIGFGTSVLGDTLANIPSGDFDVLDGQVSESIVRSITDNGVSVDLTFTFGTNTGTMNEGTRLGINSGFNQGTAGNNAINEGEILSLEVSALVTNVPAGQEVTALNFGITDLDLVRPAPSNGSNRYIWNSSAGASISPFTSATGAQPFETLDGASVFDILGTPYLATFTVDDNGDNNVSGFRWVTNSDNVNFHLDALTAAVPEPASIAIWSLFGLALGFGYLRFRRKR